MKTTVGPDGDADMVCGLDVCDELEETHFADTYVNDCDGDYIDETTGATLRRDDAAKVRTMPHENISELIPRAQKNEFESCK